VVTNHKITRNLQVYVGKKKSQTSTGWYRLDRLPPHGASLKKSLQILHQD
jgi:hypothetical protein